MDSFYDCPLLVTIIRNCWDIIYINRTISEVCGCGTIFLDFVHNTQRCGNWLFCCGSFWIEHSQCAIVCGCWICEGSNFTSLSLCCNFEDVQLYYEYYSQDLYSDGGDIRLAGGCYSAFFLWLKQIYERLLCSSSVNLYIVIVRKDKKFIQ